MRTEQIISMSDALFCAVRTNNERDVKAIKLKIWKETKIILFSIVLTHVISTSMVDLRPQYVHHIL